MEFVEREFKTVLNVQKYIDAWFWCRYTLNPYNGCHFGCIYCDARSEKYRMPEDFENPIVVKQGAAAMLDRRLSRARTLRPDVVAMAGATDPYQPAEKKFRNTRAVLEVLARHLYPVHIITKSNLVLEDADLLNEIAGAAGWAAVSVTLPAVREEVARFLDTKSPAAEKRLAALAELKRRAAGGPLKVGALLIPLVPVIADRPEDLAELFRRVKATGADYILFGGGMTLRDRQALWFLEKLCARFPERLADFQRLYGFTLPALAAGRYDGRHVPQPNYLLEKNRLLRELAAEQELAVRIPRYLPGDDRYWNYLVAENLLNEAYFRQLEGGAGWEAWFWAGQNIQNLKQSLRELPDPGRIRNVRGPVLERVRQILAAAAPEPGPPAAGRQPNLFD